MHTSNRSGVEVSTYLISGVHLQCLLDLWLRKYNQFIYFLLFLTLTGSVPNRINVTAIFDLIIIFMVVGRYSN